MDSVHWLWKLLSVHYDSAPEVSFRIRWTKPTHCNEFVGFLELFFCSPECLHYSLMEHILCARGQRRHYFFLAITRERARGNLCKGDDDFWHQHSIFHGDPIEERERKRSKDTFHTPFNLSEHNRVTITRTLNIFNNSCTLLHQSYKYLV